MNVEPSLILSIIVNVLLVGVFVGTTRQNIKALTDAGTSLKAELHSLGVGLDRLRSDMGESQQHRAGLEVRVASVERDEKLLRDLNDSMIRLTTTYDVNNRQQVDAVSKLQREMIGVQRQLANAMSSKGSTLYELDGGDK